MINRRRDPIRAWPGMTAAALAGLAFGAASYDLARRWWAPAEFDMNIVLNPEFVDEIDVDEVVCLLAWIAENPDSISYG